MKKRTPEELQHSVLARLLEYRASEYIELRSDGLLLQQVEDRFDSILQHVINRLNVGIVITDVPRGKVETFMPGQRHKTIKWMSATAWKNSKRTPRKAAANKITVQSIPVSAIQAAIAAAKSNAPAA